MMVRSPRRFVSTQMALALGFGILLTLLVLSGLNAVRTVAELRSSNEDILEGFLARQTRLDELRSAIYLSGTYVRDYLLEPDPPKAEESRLALVDTRSQIQEVLSITGESDALIGDAGGSMYQGLKNEVRDYWQTIAPVLSWDARQRHNNGYRFLHDEVLPRRSNMLRIADTIAKVNQQQLMERDHLVVTMFVRFRNQLLTAMAVMFLGGLVLASVAAVHILRLETQTMAHLGEVTEARQELRNLSARLVEGQENERKNISRELHDAVGQSMSAVQFELHDLGVALAQYPDPLRTRVDRIRELVESSVAMVRNMALLLRPSMLDDLGLEAALRWQAEQISRSTGIRIDISAPTLPCELPEGHKICVFRVVQEALNNVCRHAGAHHAAIELSFRTDELHVAVRDDGRGFRLPRKRGLGLLGMRERVESLGGRLVVESEFGKGAKVEISLPLPHLAPEVLDPLAASVET
jgi:signal transduction histidine kinase